MGATTAEAPVVLVFLMLESAAEEAKWAPVFSSMTSSEVWREYWSARALEGSAEWM